MDHSNEFQDNLPRFDIIIQEEKDKLMENRKAKNTNRATKQWVDCFKSYLNERKLGKIEDLQKENLPEIMGDFYFSLRKKQPNKTKDKNVSEINAKFYKNSSLKSGRAALNRYFKEKMGIDIISNDAFMKANENFQAVTRDGKIKGRGETQAKQPILDTDMSKLSSYFVQNVQGPPNAKLLQEMVLFNIIYYGGRRGRENLREMNVDMFQIETDSDGRKCLHQVIKECDKNHNEQDFSESNEARIYKMAG